MVTMTRPSRRQMYAEQTRAALVEAARRLFVDQGFAGTSVEAVTGAALVSKGAFYHHFPDKTAMFAELYTERIEQVAALVDAACEAVDGAPDDGKVAGIAQDLTLAFLRRTIDDPLHRELMAQAPSALGPQYREINDRVAQPALERLLNAMAARGSLKPDVPVAAVARLVLAALCEGNQMIAAAADPEDTLASTGRALTLILSGLAADAGTAPAPAPAPTQ